MSKKARSREQRTKPGTADKLTPVRIVISQSEYLAMKQLERSRNLSREDIFRMGLQNCQSR